MLVVTLVKGIAVGIVIALPAGPVGILCVRRTLFEGPFFGLVSGLGAACADTIFGSIAALGLTFVRDELLAYGNFLAVAGGFMLLYFGARALLVGRMPAPEPLDGEALLGAFASTFALTITNPVTILAFAGIFAKFGATDTGGLIEVAILIGGVLAGSLVWWLGLSFGIAALQRRARGFDMASLNRVSGAILTVSGAGLLAAAGLGFAGIAL
jgi:threonine/homoserine/homoserine lactone efflux protein